MEQRLIDANPLIDLVSKEKAPIWWKELISGWIEKQPTVDAVPVVRCHECCYWDRGTIRWNGKQNEAICDMFHERGISQDIWTVADYFCADGERRSE